MQTVSLGSVNSDIQTVCCGVPQGSVLGPLLFLIYIDDFHNCSELLDVHLFADDANLSFKHNDINILESEINSELANVHIWLSVNKLSLNIEKSNCVIFHLMQKRIPKKVILFVSNQSFTEENCIRYHGVYIDSNISWKSHINYIAKLNQKKYRYSL